MVMTTIASGRLRSCCWPTKRVVSFGMHAARRPIHLSSCPSYTPEPGWASREKTAESRSRLDIPSQRQDRRTCSFSPGGKERRAVVSEFACLLPSTFARSAAASSWHPSSSRPLASPERRATYVEGEAMGEFSGEGIWFLALRRRILLVLSGRLPVRNALLFLAVRECRCRPPRILPPTAKKDEREEEALCLLGKGLGCQFGQGGGVCCDGADDGCALVV